jgi:hypothetical protein
MKNILFTIILLSIIPIRAQQAMLASGGNVKSKTGSCSYSVGQVFYGTHKGVNDNILLQGVQHLFNFQTLSNPGLTVVNLTAVTYPNPTKDFIILKITDPTFTNLRYSLFDVNGKAIVSDSITTAITEIQMSHLSQGAYVLKVWQEDKSFETFKILKQ